MKKNTLEPYIRNLEDRTTLEEIKKNHPFHATIEIEKTR